jgi:predicted homoserine dehydrogenase-like protein
VDWARASGFDVVCAGKGAKYLPAYNASTPDTVWDHFGFTPEMVTTGDYNPKMYNAFLDGTKAAIEMAAVADATGLIPQPSGLSFPPCGTDDLAHILRPESAGGQLAHKGTVEVVSSLERDGRPVYRHMRWAVFVIIEADTEYVQRCFVEYGIVTDSTGRYAAMYRPYHLVGLELSVSVLQAGLRGEATGTTTAFNGDVVATAKRALAAGEVLDGEGGYCVFGKLMPAEHSLRIHALPIGLAHNLRLKNAVPPGETVCWSDVEYDEMDPTVSFRREMERQFAGAIR